VCVCVCVCVCVRCIYLLRVNLQFCLEAQTANFLASVALDKPDGVWLLKAVYMHCVYLKVCKLKFKTVCVLKFMGV
jgi:hypothetical protein